MTGSSNGGHPANSRSFPNFPAHQCRDAHAPRRTRRDVDTQRTLLRRSGGTEHALTAPLPARPRIAQPRVLERYRLLERLGAGGFGVVWRAHDELLHRDVALKRIWLGPDGDSERATREALAAARLRHPAIVALYEACSHDGAFYLISELVEGDTLARLIAADELTDEHAIEIGLALVSALSHAHARGVIHRDIKPHNVLVPASSAHRGESAKLTDFGGASLAGEDALTRTGNVVGTLAYMAPEQSEGADAGEEADLYSLALVLYEALCGVNPVRGPTPAATVRRIGRPLEPLARRRRDLPRELCLALDHALAPSPTDRGTLAELGLGLEEALELGLPRRRRRMGLGREHDRRHPSRIRAAAQVPPDSQIRPDPGLRAAPLAAGALEHAHALDEDAREQDERAREADGQPYTHLREDARAQRRPVLPRKLWLALLLAFVFWEAFSGLAGVSLLVLAALLPALFVRGEDGSARLPIGRLYCALSPLLGVIGLAGAFPAIAGQPRAAVERAARGAIGYWWLILASPLLARVLWLAPASSYPARGAWEGSLTLTATRIIAPSLTLAVALGALLWGAAAVVLPWIVRGRRASLDLLAAACWAAALALAERALDSGLSSGAHPEPRGALLGAVLAGALAIALRAVRGPT